MSQDPRFGLIDADSAALMVIDIQEKLLTAIHEGDRMVERAARMMEGARILDVPVIVTEQYPKGLGPTVPPIADLVAGLKPLEKTTFGCFSTPAILEAVRDTGATTLILVGIEAHVCVTQTALGALAKGFNVHVVSDAVSSRAPENAKVALARLRQAGAVVTSSERALFELLHDAARPAFKEILRLVR